MKTTIKILALLLLALLLNCAAREDDILANKVEFSPVKGEC